MIIVGESINSTRKAIARSIEKADSEHIREVARAQVEAGADIVDVNAGVFLDKEPQHLVWLVKTIQEVVDVSLSLDSTSPEALSRALEVHHGRGLLNSISGEKARIDRLIPIIREYKPSVIALCMDDDGLPESPEKTVAIASTLVEVLNSNGMASTDIFLDPLIRPIGTNPTFGRLGIESVLQLKEKIPEVKTICGLSNVSFGLPSRRLLNQNYLSMLVAAGIDAVIADALDRRLMANVKASLALCGSDEYCIDYLKAYREGRLA